jgi:hypothetical protein
MKNKLFLIFGLIILFSLTFVSASRLPSVGSDNSTWGDVLNDYLTKLAGANATELNETMVNGTNIYSSSINTTHILDKTITGNDLADNSVNSSAIDLTEVTLSTFTNDANYLDKDEGGTIGGSLIINGNLTLIGSYLNATVTNQYLNGSFLPEITNLFDLGTSLLKWANIYVTNLYASKIYSDDWSNVTIQESQISDLQSYLTSESDPLYSAWDKDYGDLINTPTIPTIWDAAFNTTGDNRWGGADTQKSADGIYLYNDTSTIYFNETKLNDTIDNKIAGISGDNSSWNESYADTKYLGIADQRYNETSLITDVNTTLSSRIDSIDEGNSSFNQTLTDTLYAGIEWDYNQTVPAMDYTDSVNQSQSSWIENTFAKIIDIFTKSEIQESYYNKTEIDDLGFIDTESDPVFVAENSTLWTAINSKLDETDQSFNETTLILSINTTSNIMSLGFYNESEIDDLISSAGNSSFNQTLTDTLYYSITNPLNFLNQTQADLLYAPIGYGDEWNKTYADTLYLNRTSEGLYLSTYNATYDLWAYNQTTPANAYADAQDVIFNDSMKDYVDTQISGISEGNSSFNQSLTDTLYANIQWGYNMTTPFTDWLSTFAYNYNQTAPAMDYADSQDVIFNDSMKDYVDAQISGVEGDNSSWNESYADTKYISQGDEANLNVNSSDYWNNLGTINATQMENNGGTLNILVSWLTSLFYTKSEVDSALAGQDECSEITGCVENAITTSDADTAFINATGDTMTGNLNMSSNNVTSVDCIVFASGGKICSG